MRTKLLLPEYGRGSDCGIRVSILYEDDAAGRMALDTYQQLLSEFGGEFAFQLSIWRFDLLQAPTLMEEAVETAIKANLIIVATQQRDELPPAIKRWIDAWTPRKRSQTAILIALLDPLGISNGVHEYLKAVAVTAGMDFLAHPIQPAGNSRRHMAIECHPSCRLAREGWGLNE